jgi:hypothetical protein
MGTATAALCVLGFWQDRWFLAHTGKGRALVRKLGDDRARWVLRSLFAAGIVLGVLLATGVVNPMRWE